MLIAVCQSNKKLLERHVKADELGTEIAEELCDMLLVEIIKY